MRWTLLTASEDLDFADDYQHVQEKTSRLIIDAQKIGLKISQPSKKTEVMTLNIPSTPPPTPLVQMNREDLPTTEESTHLGSTGNLVFSYDYPSMGKQ